MYFIKDNITKEDVKYIRMYLYELDEALNNEALLNDFLRGNDYIFHVYLHRQAFKSVESGTAYIGRFNLEHDLDKLTLAFNAPVSWVKNFHKRAARHHNFDWGSPDHDLYVEKMIDWESQQFTDIGGGKSAWEYMVSKNYNEFETNYSKDILNELNLPKTYSCKPVTEYEYNKMVDTINQDDFIKELKGGKIFMYRLLESLDE